VPPVCAAALAAVRPVASRAEHAAATVAARPRASGLPRRNEVLTRTPVVQCGAPLAPHPVTPSPPGVPEERGGLPTWGDLPCAPSGPPSRSAGRTVSDFCEPILLQGQPGRRVGVPAGAVRRKFTDLTAPGRCCRPRPAGPTSAPVLSAVDTPRTDSGPLAEPGRHSGCRCARTAAVISTPFPGVSAVAAMGVLWAFATSWTRYLNTVSAAGPVQIPLSMHRRDGNGAGRLAFFALRYALLLGQKSCLSQSNQAPMSPMPGPIRGRIQRCTRLPGLHLAN
jgi:hypothetical protein